MLINFKEISQANNSDGDQDDFELFARDFLEEMGYTIVEEPARGADGGKDLIVIQQDGSKSDEQVRWLVSCKHYAHSGRGVGLHDEPSILDRTRAKNCIGFLGFYSTMPTESLLVRLRGLEKDISHLVFDKGKIEKYIVGYPDREAMFQRFFPESYKRWRDLHYYAEPVRLFNAYFVKKHKNYIQFFEYVFGKTENLIRLLKDYESTEEVFRFQNLEITVSDQAINDIFRLKSIDENAHPQETINKILFEEIPQIISEEQGIDIRAGVYGNIMMMPVIQHKIRKNSKIKAAYIQYHPEEKNIHFAVDFCVIYRNHIVLTKTLYKSVTRVFDDLRAMLVLN